MIGRTAFARMVVGPLVGALLALPAPVRGQEAEDEDRSDSRITDEVIPLQLEDFPNRPKPLLELGTPFLGTGEIGRGFSIPGGAVWTPSFLLFGSFRTGVGVIDDGTTTVTQWANRLDLFGNLYLTSSERFVFGLRPIDETTDGGRFFSGYTSVSPDPESRSGFNDHLNLNWDTVSHLFFEGDLGELFPGMDLDDSSGLDIGFSVGRQPINFQEGLLINDAIDAVGFTQTNFKPDGAVNLRLTGLFGWNQINRNTPSEVASERNAEADSSQLVGAFAELDTRAATMAFDVVYVRSDEFRSDADGSVTPAGDGIYAGVSIVGRPGSGSFNTALRVVTSIPVGEETAVSDQFGDPASRGTLVLGELSWTPHHTENFFYTNAFYAIDRYRAAALDPSVPGPLARAGILFAAPGLGNVPSALSTTADDAVGAAFGHQMFFGDTRQQLVFEVAGRYATLACDGLDALCDPHAIAGGARFQVAMGRRGVFVVDGFAARDWLRGIEAFGDDSRVRVGGRAELVVKF